MGQRDNWRRSWQPEEVQEQEDDEVQEEEVQEQEDEEVQPQEVQERLHGKQCTVHMPSLRTILPRRRDVHGGPLWFNWSAI